ncbi:hypothetical protein [Sphingomonas mucosissima]|nr:hypothetical protein [Sphingomonas mucosissima]
MIFDLVRPLGAGRGELEINTLAQRSLSGPDNAVHWAPEIELAVADGFAVELELPLSGKYVSDYKLGLQGTFGVFNGGKAIHGAQYLGLWNKEHRRWESSLLYIIGNRLNDRFSTLSMIGVGDVSSAGGSERSLLVNHTSFYDVGAATVVGLEVNIRTGQQRSTLIMPQVHQSLAERLDLQAGFGAARERGDAWRPQLGLRLVREL